MSLSHAVYSTLSTVSPRLSHATFIGLPSITICPLVLNTIYTHYTMPRTTGHVLQAEDILSFTTLYLTRMLIWYWHYNHSNTQSNHFITSVFFYKNAEVFHRAKLETQFVKFVNRPCLLDYLILELILPVVLYAASPLTLAHLSAKI